MRKGMRNIRRTLGQTSVYRKHKGIKQSY